ncbi:hypothetical protein HYY27_10025 [bacterium]|nr:hypothetical protein [bacterium]
MPYGEAKRVCFRLRAPRAQEVILCGTLNRRWEKTRYLKRDEKGDWYTCLALEPGEYDYRFLVDGEWRNTCDAEVAPGPTGALNRVQVSPWEKP